MKRNLSDHRHPVRRVLRAASVALVWLASGLPLAAAAAGLELIVDRLDGSVFFKNTGGSAEAFDGYTLTSPGEALLTGGWTPIAENFDADDDMSIDPTASWFVLGTPDGFSVSEASTVALSAALFPGQIFQAGVLFDLAKPEELAATVSADTETADLVADFRTLTADYDGDLDVDLDDYGVFASTFGSAVDLRADGNNDGVVNAADYSVWRDSEELSLAPLETMPTFSLVSGPSEGGFSIPEPGGVSLAGLALLLIRARRSRAPRPAAW